MTLDQGVNYLKIGLIKLLEEKGFSIVVIEPHDRMTILNVQFISFMLSNELFVFISYNLCCEYFFRSNNYLKKNLVEI